MKIFEQVKIELLEEYKIKLNNWNHAMDDPNIGTLEFKQYQVGKLNKSIDYLDEMTRIRIANSAQHIVEMAFQGKSLDTILQFNQLGITKEDTDIIRLIENCQQAKIPQMRSQLVQGIFDKMNINIKLPTMEEMTQLKEEINSVEPYSIEYYEKKRQYDLNMLSIGLKDGKLPVGKIDTIPEEINMEYDNIITKKTSKMRM